MRSVIPTGIGGDALKEFLLQKLSSNILDIVSSLDGSLDSLVTRADKVMEVSSPQNIDTVAKDQKTGLASTVFTLSQVQSWIA